MRTKAQVTVFAALAAVAALAGCEGASHEAAVVPLAGGATTAVDRTSNAFSLPAPNLDADDLSRHLDGDAAFEANFVSAPATINAGLGPKFNNSSCARCHVRDGRGLPVTGNGHRGSTLLVRVSVPQGQASVPGGAAPANELGTQLQDHAIYGFVPEASIDLVWREVEGRHADGQAYLLRAPSLGIRLADGQPLDAGVLTSARVPPAVFGLGLLEALSEETVLGLADPNDADGDGVSGRANLVWSVSEARAALGRFGWKSNTPDLLQQAAAAYANDMGVSSPLFPEPDGTFEVDAGTLSAVTFYTQTLAVPRRERATEPEVQQGESLFRSAGCGACHVEALRTGAHPIAGLSHQLIHPYSDLLLHDLGPGLADGRPDFLASGSEWRTTPLWGLGLTETVLPYSSYLHDGRARSIEEAILWHGGEGERSKEAFRNMSRRDRAALLAFLRSL